QARAGRQQRPGQGVGPAGNVSLGGWTRAGPACTLKVRPEPGRAHGPGSAHPWRALHDGRSRMSSMSAVAPSSVHPVVAARLRRTAFLCGVAVVVLGGLGLLGWILGNDALRGSFAAGITMKTNTAIGLILLGAALLLQQEG